MKSRDNYKLSSCCALLGLMFLLNVPSAWSEDTDKGAEKEKTFLEYLKGQPTDTQLSLGMWTYHFDPKSREKDNWNQKLIGIQYNDYFLALFENSFYNWCVTAGIARNLSSTKLSDNWDMNFGYRLGLAAGYKDGEAPFSTVSPIIPIVEIYNQYYFQKHFGVELMLTTSISAGFFYQF